MTCKTQSPIFAFITAAALPLGGAAHAATLTAVNDPFTDGARTNGADPLDIQWFGIRSSTLAVGNNAAIGSGNALNVTTSTSFSRIAGVFSSLTLLAGETLRLSFDYALVSAPGTAPAGLRIGLFNNGGTPFTADTATGNGSIEQDDNGYGFSTNPGLDAADGTRIAEEAADPGNSILGGPAPGGFNFIGSAGASVESGTTMHSALFTMTRNLDGSLSMTASIDGGTAATATTGTSPFTYTFNEVGFGQGSFNGSYSIDNVVIDVVPEPSAALLSVLGALALFRRRR